MHKRCNKKTGLYASISICDRWADYTAFLADMGECPDGMSIDRIDNSKGYEPGNCRWATPKQQIRNRDYTHRLPDGRFAVDVCEENGIKSSTFQMRLQMGWTVERAATQPSRVYVNHGRRRRPRRLQPTP